MTWFGIPYFPVWRNKVFRNTKLHWLHQWIQLIFCSWMILLDITESVDQIWLNSWDLQFHINPSVYKHELCWIYLISLTKINLYSLNKFTHLNQLTQINRFNPIQSSNVIEKIQLLDLIPIKSLQLKSCS